MRGSGRNRFGLAARDCAAVAAMVAATVAAARIAGATVAAAAAIVAVARRRRGSLLLFARRFFAGSFLAFTHRTSRIKSNGQVAITGIESP